MYERIFSDKFSPDLSVFIFSILSESVQGLQSYPSILNPGYFSYLDHFSAFIPKPSEVYDDINAACKLNGTNYSTFMNGLKKAGVTLNRKMLSEIAIADPQGFTKLVETANKAL